MRSSNGTARHTIDWRDWVAFLGYVLATSVVVSVALASVVLLISTQADDPSSGFADSPSQRPLPPSATMLRQGPVPAPASTASASASTGTPAGVARAQETAIESAAKLPLAPVPGASPASPATTGSSATGLPGSSEAQLGIAAILQPIPEPSPTAAAILQPGSAHLEAAKSVVEAAATIDIRTGFPTGASTSGG